MSDHDPSAISEAPRIGLGTDLHRLEAGRPCILGGVHFEDCEVGPAGHSDGDAVLHAICDAMLGAAGLDDLGTLFPDSSQANRDRSSREFLAEATRAVEAKRLRLASLDIVVQCDRPKLAPRRAELREVLASLLGLPVDRVNIKGKTFERTAQREVVAVQAVALLVPRR